MENEWFELLQSVDLEFYPPLSSRNSTSQSQLIQSDFLGLSDYFNGLKQQQNVFLRNDKNELQGFASYKENFEIDGLKSLGKVAYLTTIATAPIHRKNGLGQKLYEKLFEDLKTKEIASLVTRTWSTNSSHIPLLMKLGFTEVLRLKDHRGPGVDTVYFHLDLKA